ncbi:MAG TPA: hypothetical protein VN364_03780 [Bellilinea sp.]|nr:hypothetical protein [Bellilinea sp.]
MMSSNKWLPLALILLGSSLIFTLATFSIFGFPQPNPSPNPNLPQSLVNLPLSKQLTGSEALAEFNQLHGKSLAVTSGVKGTYGEWGAITLWVAGAESAEEIQDLLVAMAEKIARGNSPFIPEKTIQHGGKTIYVLNGMEQRHFYFQSANILIWLAADPAIADQALQETLNFYQ